MATLLPNAVQQFFSATGEPLASGTVYFYVPSTTTFKDTWSDSGGTTLNTNPIVLNAAGENPAGGIYGAGIYRQVVYDSSGDLVWDQLTADTAVGGVAWGGVSTGTANAQVIDASTFSQQDGQEVSFIAGFTNNAALTVAPGGDPAIPVLKDTSSGPGPLDGGEVVEDNAVLMIYESSRGAFHLVSYPATVTPAGAVVAMAMDTPPTGYLECDGSSVLRADYAVLFSAIGTTFGAADATHFNIPDIRGYFVRGWDNGRGVDSGRTFGSNQADELESHTHTFTGSALAGHTHSISLGIIDSTGTLSADANTAGGTGTTGSTSAGTPAGTNASTGGTETRPINIALMYCIKY